MEEISEHKKLLATLRALNKKRTALEDSIHAHNLMNFALTSGRVQDLIASGLGYDSRKLLKSACIRLGFNFTMLGTVTEQQLYADVQALAQGLSQLTGISKQEALACNLALAEDFTRAAEEAYSKANNYHCSEPERSPSDLQADDLAFQYANNVADLYRLSGRLESLLRPPIKVDFITLHTATGLILQVKKMLEYHCFHLGFRYQQLPDVYVMLYEQLQLSPLENFRQSRSNDAALFKITLDEALYARIEISKERQKFYEPMVAKAETLLGS